MRQVKQLTASLLIIGGFLAIAPEGFSPREIVLKGRFNPTLSAYSQTVPENPLATSKRKLQELEAKFPEYATSTSFYSDAQTKIQAFEKAYDTDINGIPESVTKRPRPDVIDKSHAIRGSIKDAKDLFNLLTSVQYQAAQETLRDKNLYENVIDTTDGPGLRRAAREYLKQLADGLNSNLEQLESLIKSPTLTPTPTTAPTPAPAPLPNMATFLLVGVNIIAVIVILMPVGVLVFLIKKYNLPISSIPSIPSKIQQLLNSLRNNSHGASAALSKLDERFLEIEHKLTGIDAKINTDNLQSRLKQQFQQSSNQLTDDFQQQFATPISLLNNLTARVEHLIASTQSLDIFQLIEAFNQNPQLLQEQGLQAYEVAERPPSKRQLSSKNKDVFLEKPNTNKGDFWILDLGSHSYLFPKEKGIRESQKVITQRLFQGYKPGDTSNFILVKPAKVTPMDNFQQWKLEAKGELKPEELESRYERLEAEKEQWESKYHQQSRDLEKFQERIVTLSEIESKYQQQTEEYRQQKEEKKELESHCQQLEGDKEELQGKYNRKSKDVAKLTQDIAKLRQDHTEQLQSKNQELQELALDRAKLTQDIIDLEQKLQQQAHEERNIINPPARLSPAQPNQEILEELEANYSQLEAHKQQLEAEKERLQETNNEQSLKILVLTENIVRLELQLQLQTQEARNDI